MFDREARFLLLSRLVLCARTGFSGDDGRLPSASFDSVAWFDICRVVCAGSGSNRVIYWSSDSMPLLLCSELSRGCSSTTSPSVPASSLMSMAFVS